MKKKYFYLLLLFLLIQQIQAQKNNPKVTINLWSDIDRINPLTSTSADATHIQNNIFNSLLKSNSQNFNLEIDLAIALPKISLIDSGEYKGGMSLEFEIRQEAVWDNGSPITAEDYIFTVKAIKNPRVEAATSRPYYTFINDIIADKSNKKKFIIYSKERYFLAEHSAGSLLVLPEHMYDSSQIMRKFSIGDLDTIKRMYSHNQIMKFGEQFNKLEFSKMLFVGSGAYSFDSWKFQDKIVLIRKKNYWKDNKENINNKNKYPDSLIFKINQEYTDFTNKIDSQNLDVVLTLNPTLFVELQKNKKYKSEFNFHTTDQFAYSYIGINCNKIALSDKKTRQALAYLVDRQQILKKIYKGQAQITNSPINPLKSYYDKKLRSKNLNLKKAKQLLKEAGWADTDKNGILDKFINGQKVELELTFKYNTESKIRQQIAAVVQKDAALARVKINLQSLEWATFLEHLNKSDFDLCISAWQQSPNLDDMYQLWHSKNSSGSNRLGFGNEESDKIIDAIRISVIGKERDALYKKIQQIIAEEQPCIFLFTSKERLMIRKKFYNTPISAASPNVVPSLFQVK